MFGVLCQLRIKLCYFSKKINNLKVNNRILEQQMYILYVCFSEGITISSADYNTLICHKSYKKGDSIVTIFHYLLDNSIAEYEHDEKTNDELFLYK